MPLVGLLVFLLSVALTHRKGIGLQVQRSATEDEKQHDPLPVETNECGYGYQQQQHGSQGCERLESENRTRQGGDQQKALNHGDVKAQIGHGRNTLPCHIEVGKKLIVPRAFLRG